LATIHILDPISRIEGHLTVEITIDTVAAEQQVVDARASGTMFRGFEILLRGRPPGDAPHLTQRICGVCPVSHGLAAVMALESAGAAAVPENARLLRNLVLGSNYLASHILHFYHLSLLDFVAGPDRPPWTPRWETDLRITGTAAQTLVDHYVLALGMRRKAHEMGALFGGRLPHPPTYVAGGFTTTPRSERIARFGTLLDELIAFIESTWSPDVESVATAYPEYLALGAGPRNLLSYGVFDLDAAGSSKLLKRGRIEAGAPAVLAVSPTAITEAVAYSWFEDTAAPTPPSLGATVPQHPKTNAYSWLKAPRYLGKAYEVGPLARMWVNGNYSGGISVMDRHRARVLEALKLANAMKDWLAAVDSNAPVYAPYTSPASGHGVGLTEAARGALGHWLTLGAGQLDRYQVITPTCWNASPRDDAGTPGPLEQALIGTPVADAAQPIEVLRVIHSIDPCLACAVHVMRPKRSFVATVLG
jgi:hydrogenase large subunit